jgi:hypothetical protein
MQTEHPADQSKHKKRPYSKRRSFKWSPAARQLVRDNLDASGPTLRALITKLASETGYPRRACRRFVRQLGLKACGKYVKWTESEQKMLLELLDQHTVQEIARIMHRTQQSIYGMLYRLGANAKVGQDWFTVRSLAEALFLPQSRIRHWTDQGWLKATQKAAGTRRRTIIKADHFAEFCKEHPREIVGHRVHRERLEFVYRFVFPPSHAALLPVRESKKERAAFEEQMPSES